MFKFQLFKMIAIFITVMLISLITGSGWVSTEIHETGNAQYMKGNYCIVNNTVTQEEYLNLLDWCKVKYSVK